MTDADVLVRARALVLRGWCKGAYARDWHQAKVEPLDERAAAFDALGSIWRAGRDLGADPSAVSWAISRMQKVAHAHSTSETGGLTDWNDRRTRDEVLAAFDRAIAFARDAKRCSA